MMCGRIPILSPVALLLQADANHIQAGQDFTGAVTPHKEFNVQDWIALFHALLHWWRTHRPQPAF